MTDAYVPRAVRKIAIGEPECLNFLEVRALGLRFGQSWEREIEMAVDKAVNHQVPLTLQFFDDAHGPRLGYSGAVDSLEGYVGQSCAPGLTQEAVDKLRAYVDEVGKRIARSCGYTQVDFCGVEYARALGIWHHAATGKSLEPRKSDGSAMTDAEFRELIAQLEALAVTYGPSYCIMRTGEASWIVDGVKCASLAAAVDACSARDEKSGVDWDLSMPGECRDGLTAIPVGKCITVDLTSLIDA